MILENIDEGLQESNKYKIMSLLLERVFLLYFKREEYENWSDKKILERSVRRE